MRRSNRLRRAAAGLAVVCALAAAVPAAAAPPAWGGDSAGGWASALAGRLTGWWAAAWGGSAAGPASVRAEAAPSAEPDGVGPLAEGSDDLGTLTATAPTDEGEAAPRLDPNG